MAWELIKFLAGLFFLVKLAYHSLCLFSRVIHLYVISRYFPRDIVSKYGKWAVVTGCTGGIGYELVLELARKGFNIALVSRNYEKLRHVADIIEQQMDRKTRIIIANALERSSIDVIKEAVQDLDIGILVNNVGLNSRTGTDDLFQLERSKLLAMINVNAGYLAALTRALGEKLVNKRYGLIVNMGSTSGFIPIPYQNIYNATKSFAHVLSLSLAKELQPLDMCYLYPQFVRTEMMKINKLIYNSPVWTQNADDYVKNAVPTLGQHPETPGHWLFEICAALLSSEVLKDINQWVTYVVVRHMRKMEICQPMA